MHPYEVRRVAAGAVAECIRAQKAKRAAIIAEEGRTSRRAKNAIARLDELKDAFTALTDEQSSERFARAMLSTLVHELDEGDEEGARSTVAIVREWLAERG